MEEIEQIKFYNSIKIGRQEIVSLNFASGVKIFIDGNMIKVVDEENTVYTTLYNVVWYKLLKDKKDVSKQTIIPSSNKVPSETPAKKNSRSKLSKAE